MVHNGLLCGVMFCFQRQRGGAGGTRQVRVWSANGLLCGVLAHYVFWGRGVGLEALV
jgi:hypothetical protein